MVGTRVTVEVREGLLSAKLGGAVLFSSEFDRGGVVWDSASTNPGEDSDVFSSNRILNSLKSPWISPKLASCTIKASSSA